MTSWYAISGLSAEIALSFQLEDVISTQEAVYIPASWA